MKIIDKKWEAVSINSIFTFERGKEKNMAALAEGNIPLVSARKMNNGIKGFIANPAKTIKGGNVISLNNDGDGGAGLAYFQPVDFALDTHVTALHPKEKIPVDALIYMTASISKQHSVFGHGRSISLPRAKRIQDMLPVTNEGKPDYKYMATYTCNTRDSMLRRYRAYIRNCMTDIGQFSDIPKLSEKQWLPFKIVDLFTEIIPGKISNASKFIKAESGGIEYVAATNRNNGCLYFFVNDEKIQPKTQKGNCIGFIKDGDGSAGYAIYKQEKFTSTVNVLYGYSDWLNKYNGMFFVVAQDMIADKYSHGYKRNQEHLKGDRVMLPTNNMNEPDYEYMEQYTKNMMLKKYKQYLSFLDSKE